MRNAVSLAALTLVTLGFGGPSAWAAGSLPALPDAQAAPAAPPAAAGSGQAASADEDQAGSDVPSALERVRRGIVLVERDGHLLGFGTVLGGDGRILTSLSSLGQGDAADVRYADGTTVHAKVAHKDAAWDLALLVPHAIHWKDGLSASSTDPASTALRAPIPPRAGAKPIALPVHFKGRTDAISRQGESLVDALDVEVHNALPVVGAPILDQQATVVGVLVRACKLTVSDSSAKTGPVEATRQGSSIACAPTIIGAPVTAVRNFLARTPADANPPTAWLGIAGEPDATGSVHGVRVMAIAPQSPAQKAGLKTAAGNVAGDRIVAVDGIPVDSPEKLAEAIGKHAVGESVKLLVLGGSGSFREVAVVLRAAPP